jgi:hypothetical protein
MTGEDETNWDALSEFARRRREIDPFLLRGALANALRRKGYGSLTASEDGKLEEQRKGPGAALLTAALFWSFGVSGAIALGGAWYLWPIGILAAFAAAGALLKLLPSESIGAVLVMSWVALGVVQVIEGTFFALAVTYLVPLGLVGAYVLASRVLRLRDAQDLVLALGGVIRSAPLVAPVVLLVLFLPALSENVWQVADELSPGSLLIVGIASVGLLFVVVRLQLGSETEVTVSRRAASLCDHPNRSEMTRTVLGAVVAEGAPLLDTMPGASFEEAWPAAGEEYGPYLNAAVGESLRSPLTGRLALTVGVVGLLFTAYIYVLCAAVVPADLAEGWTKSVVPSIHLHALGAEVTLHGGPFLNLAALMGLAATATFLSFALIEERFAKALAGALLQDPIDRFLVLALPYAFLWERAIEEGRDERQASSGGSSPSP